MKTNFNFQRNGWLLTIIIDIPKKIAENNTIDVTFEIMGLVNGFGTIVLDNNFLLSHNEISVNPYKENGKVEKFYALKIPKEITKQIKSYLD